MCPPYVEKYRAAALRRRRVVPALKQSNRIGNITGRVRGLYGCDEIIFYAIGEEHAITMLLPHNVFEAELFLATDKLERELAAEREMRRLEVWIGVLEVDTVFDIRKMRRIIFVMQVSA